MQRHLKSQDPNIGRTTKSIPRCITSIYILSLQKVPFDSAK